MKAFKKAMNRAEQLIAAVEQSGFPHLDSLITCLLVAANCMEPKVKTRAIWTSTACIWNRPNSC
jgi:hypothetical protein